MQVTGITPTTLTLIAVGCLFFSIGLFFFRRSLRFIRRGIATDATVIEVAQERRLNKIYYQAIVRYMDRTGQRHETALPHKIGKSILLATSPYTIGETLPIRYLPETPKNFTTSNFIGLWLFATLFSLAGTLQIVTGLMMSGVLLFPW